MSFSNLGHLLTQDSLLDEGHKSPPWAVAAFYYSAIALNICLVIQVLTVGIAYFYSPATWSVHIWWVRGHGGLTFLLALWAYLFPTSKRIRQLALSLPILLFLQFLSIHWQGPFRFPLAVLHPLNGFILVSLSSTLVHRLGQHHRSATEVKTA